MFFSFHTGNIASSVSFSLQDANYAYPTRQGILNWMDHLIPLIMSMFASKTPRGDKHVSKYFQTATALKHRNAKLKLYPHSTLHFKILKNKPAVTSNVRETETAGPSNTMRNSQ